MAESGRIAIFGTGAMAMLFGARLARAGNDVLLLGRWTAGLEAMRSSGIEVHPSVGGRAWRAPVRVRHLDSPPSRNADSADLALVLVKAAGTRAVGGDIAGELEPNGTVATLQNGLGNSDVLRELSGRRVVDGVTTAAARVLDPGKVQEASIGKTVLPASEKRLAERLETAGFEVDRVPDVRPHAWLKLAVNCAVNPLSALHGVPNGDLAKIPEARQLMMEAASEVGAVAGALGIELPEDPVHAALRVARESGPNLSSMLQDILRGAPTEIEALSGAIERLGREIGVLTPTSSYLLRQIRRQRRAAARARRPD